VILFDEDKNLSLVRRSHPRAKTRAKDGAPGLGDAAQLRRHAGAVQIGDAIRDLKRVVDCFDRGWDRWLNRCHESGPQLSLPPIEND
jgi:hypothetical protein